MSLQFSRSMRVLRLDSFRAARIGLLLAAVNMAVLVLWFFLAKVTLFEVSSTIQPGVEGRVVATFPDDSMRRIHSGQSAWLQIDLGGDGRPVRFPAFVYDIPLDGDHVEFVVLSQDFSTDLLTNRIKGRVEVEVEHVSPAELVMRTSNRLVDNNQVPVSPQNLNEVP